ncbi:hypothetical protein R3I94_000324 [Phoxinus phoxinus]
MYIFWHTITLAVVNAWLLYKQHSLYSQDAKEGDTEHEKVPSTVGFLSHYERTAIFNQQEPRDRSPPNSGKRPHMDDGSPKAPSSKKSRKPPPMDVRMDQTGHFPLKTKRGHCRHCSKGYTNTQCSKCDVRLCFSEDRNRFWDYHYK